MHGGFRGAKSRRKTSNKRGQLVRCPGCGHVSKTSTCVPLSAHATQSPLMTQGRHGAPRMSSTVRARAAAAGVVVMMRSVLIHGCSPCLFVSFSAAIGSPKKFVS